MLGRRDEQRKPAKLTKAVDGFRTLRSGNSCCRILTILIVLGVVAGIVYLGYSLHKIDGNEKKQRQQHSEMAWERYRRDWEQYENAQKPYEIDWKAYEKDWRRQYEADWEDYGWKRYKKDWDQYEKDWRRRYERDWHQRQQLPEPSSYN